MFEWRAAGTPEKIYSDYRENKFQPGALLPALLLTLKEMVSSKNGLTEMHQLDYDSNLFFATRL